MPIRTRFLARRGLRYGRRQFWLAGKFFFPLLPLFAVALITLGLIKNSLYWSINSAVTWGFGVLFSLGLVNLAKVIYDESCSELDRLAREHRASTVRDALTTRADTSLPPKIDAERP